MLMDKVAKLPETIVPAPYLVFLGGQHNAGFAKTAQGLRDWARNRCVGEWSSDGVATIGLPRVSPADAVALGARSMVIGVANVGGAIDPSWLPELTAALEAGLDLVSGLHGTLSDHAALALAANRGGARLIDVRIPPAAIPVADGTPRTGKRLLTVGTDCALGKKYTALAIAKAFRELGVDADFRATGQTGIMIAGQGIPIDSVVVDFAAGAAEMLSPSAAPDHWDVIEGQGSLFHPSYAGVSLALLHGSQPDCIVMCHDPGRERILGLEDFALPSIEEAIALTLALARRTNPAVRCAGVALNTGKFTADEAHRLMAETAASLGLPVADPMRGGTAFGALVDRCLEPTQ